MGKIKNKDDVAHYTMRLNLTNPDHLLVHQTLQNLNKDVHKSQNNFIFESVLRNIKNYTREELLSDAAKQRAREEGCVTRKDLNEMEGRVRENLMKEVVTLLCSSLAGRVAASVPQIPIEVEKSAVSEQLQPENDETLSDLSDIWS